MPFADSPSAAAAHARGGRNLALLKDTAATWRTLNLISVWERFGEDPLWRERPFFRNPVLNRGIVLKHRLRPHEQELFGDGRRSATKVVLPINVCDLRAGGRSFLVGQRGYETVLDELGMRGEGSREDRDVLELLDGLPSLDPFLLRERMRISGRHPARCYFEISNADAMRMFEFTRREISPLIGISFREIDHAIGDKVSKLAGKLLNNAGDAELEPLRTSMGMDRAAFEEGVFSWKGFIYYKWSLSDLAPKIRPVSAEIARIRPQLPASPEMRAYIQEARGRIASALVRACAQIRDSLKIYDDAYAAMTQAGQPRAFRDFLLDAPSLFQTLGEQVGAVQHIVSFWRFRIPAGAEARVPAPELEDMLTDFVFSLQRQAERAREAA